MLFHATCSLPVGAAQPWSPKLTVLYHMTRRLQPPRSHGAVTGSCGLHIAGKNTFPLTVAAGKKLRPAAQVGKLRTAMAQQWAETQWDSSIPSLVWAQTTEPPCPPGFHSSEVACGLLQILQLCPLPTMWPLESHLTSHCICFITCKWGQIEECQNLAWQSRY